MAQYSVMVVEDDPATLARLVDLIAQHPKLSVCCQASSVKEARSCLSGQKPDVLLTDLGLPDGSGIDLIRATYDQDPQMPIMVLSVFGDENSVVSAILAGAKGYILKDRNIDTICTSIIQLIDGGSPISASIARFLLLKLQNQIAPAKESGALLTERESKVLELIAQGYRSNEIASSLEVSYHTVVFHIRNVYDKLAVHSRSQAIYKASQLGLLQEK